MVCSSRSRLLIVYRIAQSAGILTRFYASLPEHNMVTMPALSPTMTTGTLASWNVAEGDEVATGDSLGEVPAATLSLSGAFSCYHPTLSHHF